MLAIRAILRPILLAALLAPALLSCTSDSTPPGPDLSLTTTSLGPVLTGSGGKTLYVFAGDVDGTPTCTGSCLDTWPAFYQATPTLGASLKAADFTTITRTDGSKQTAYKGWPLYYFKNDAKAGDVTGDNVGGTWLVAKPNYSLLLGARQLTGLDGKNYTFDTKEGTGQSVYLIDSLGRTLYAFANDKRGKNNDTTADLSNNPTWPIFTTTLVDLPSSLNRADFGTITVFGQSQLTYKGWPLYYFGSDQGVRGNTKGVSVPRPGVWPVVNSTSPLAPQS